MHPIALPSTGASSQRPKSLGVWALTASRICSAGRWYFDAPSTHELAMRPSRQENNLSFRAFESDSVQLKSDFDLIFSQIRFDRLLSFEIAFDIVPV